MTVERHKEHINVYEDFVNKRDTIFIELRNAEREVERLKEEQTKLYEKNKKDKEYDKTGENYYKDMFLYLYKKQGKEFLTTADLSTYEARRGLSLALDELIKG